MKSVSVFANALLVSLLCLFVAPVLAQPSTSHVQSASGNFSGNNVTATWSDVCTFNIPSGYGPASGKFFVRVFFDAMTTGGTLIGSSQMQYKVYTAGNNWASVSNGTVWTLSDTTASINYVTTFDNLYYAKYNVYPPGGQYTIRFRVVGYGNVLDVNGEEWPNQVSYTRAYPYLITR